MSVVNTISPEIDKDENGFIVRETYITNGGFKLSIEPQATGLYAIVPHDGGKAPEICEGRYTSQQKARQDLLNYIKETDRLGYAQYPGKPENEKRIAKYPRKNHVVNEEE